MDPVDLAPQALSVQRMGQARRQGVPETADGDETDRRQGLGWIRAHHLFEQVHRQRPGNGKQLHGIALLGVQIVEPAGDHPVQPTHRRRRIQSETTRGRLQCMAGNGSSEQLGDPERVASRDLIHTPGGFVAEGGAGEQDRQAGDLFGGQRGTVRTRSWP